MDNMDNGIKGCPWDFGDIRLDLEKHENEKAGDQPDSR
jgi:hypothetical protein